MNRVVCVRAVEPIRSDPAFFRQMIVENDTVTWPNGADIDPDVLYLGLPPHASEEQWRARRRRACREPWV